MSWKQLCRVAVVNRWKCHSWNIKASQILTFAINVFYDGKLSVARTIRYTKTASAVEMKFNFH
jgi:hypothetical protein